MRVNVKRTLSPKAPLAETLFYYQKYCNIDEKNVKRKEEDSGAVTGMSLQITVSLLE